MKSKGFTLIEIIIALGISTILFASAYEVMNIGTKFFHQQSGQVFARDDVRLVLNRITQDIQESKTVSNSSGVYIFTQQDNNDISYYYDSNKKAVIRSIDVGVESPVESVFLENVTSSFTIERNSSYPNSFTIKIQTLNLKKYWGNKETEDHSITVNRRFGDAVYLQNPLKIRKDNLPNAQVGQDYSWSFSAAGGIKPYLFSIQDASKLPAGVTMNSNGELSGKPSAVGTYSFTVIVKDSSNYSQSDSFSFTINVVSAPIIIPTDLFTYKNGDWSFIGNWNINPTITHHSQNDKIPAIYIKRKYSVYSYATNIILKGNASTNNPQQSGIIFGPNKDGSDANYFYIQVEINGQTSVFYNNAKLFDLGRFYSGMQVTLKATVTGDGKLTLYANGTQLSQYSYSTQGDWLGIQEYNKKITAEYNILTK